MFLLYNASSKNKNTETSKTQKQLFWVMLIWIIINLDYLTVILNLKPLFLGNIATILFVAFCAYLMTKERLFGINLVISKSVAVILLTVPTTALFAISQKFSTLPILTNSIIGLSGVFFGKEILLKIQTPLDKAFLTNNYSPSEVMSEVNSKLAPVFKLDNAIDILIKILKDKMEISTNV